MEPIEEIRKRWIDNDGNLTNAGDDINCHDLYIMADMRFLLAEVDRQAVQLARIKAALMAAGCSDYTDDVARMAEEYLAQPEEG
jgi:hypothetical protein